MLASLVPSRGDVFGGISAGIVALPLCLAFGAISGLGPEAGLYGAIAAGILAAIFGGSQVLVTGPTNPMTLVAATVVAANTPPGGTINLAVVMAAFLLAGALQVLLGVLRLGGFVRYVPYPVISGFMSGIGVIIIIQQLYPIVGAEAPSSNAVVILGSLSMLPGSILWPVALLGLATFAIIQLLPRLTRKVPASLVALIVVTAISVALGVDAPRIGAIPAGLPALVVPDLTFDQVPLVASVAAQLALLGAIDTLLSALLADSLSDIHRGVPLMSPTLLSHRLKELELAGLVQPRTIGAKGRQWAVDGSRDGSWPGHSSDGRVGASVRSGSARRTRPRRA